MRGSRALVPAALVALGAAGCGSGGARDRSASEIESCLRAAQFVTAVALPGRHGSFGKVAAGRVAAIAVPAVYAGIDVYPSANTATRVFAAGENAGALLQHGNVIVKVLMPPWPVSVRTKQLEACAFGQHARPTASRLATENPPRPTGPEILGQAGCLACHQLGANGNNGPGRNLTHVGARLSPGAIAHALIDPVPPMPTFKGLSRRDLKTLVAYLSGLR
jgi:hypothetical protein